MNDAQIAIAFAAGIVAAFNPCGFAMLPAYLAYFLGLEEGEGDSRGNVLRALTVGASVSLGFVIVFGIMGAIVSAASLSLGEYLPWVTMVIGGGLLILGIAMIFGYEMTVSLPKLNKGTNGRQAGSMFLFGVSYAVASLSCTLPIFLAQVTGVFTRDSFGSGLSVFATYTLGMSLVLMTLTLVVALARRSLTRKLNRVLPYINRISGILLVVAATYVVYFGWTEVRILRGDIRSDGLTDWFFELQSRVNNNIVDFGAVRLGLVLGVIVLGALAYAVLRPKRTEVDEAAASSEQQDLVST